jgi:hypothetical protein
LLAETSSHSFPSFADSEVYDQNSDYVESTKGDEGISSDVFSSTALD